MSITVATVLLNAADDLPVTLESIIQQDFDDIEVLVVDGMSWDSTHEVLDRYRGSIDRLESVEDSGIYDAMNRAAAMASKEFILFMNAGDRFHTERSLSKLWSRRRPNADVVFGNHIYRHGGIDAFRASGDLGPHLLALRSGDLSLSWLDHFPAHQATLTRTSLIREMGYDTAYRICADHDFLLRAVHAGAMAQYVDEIVAIYTGGGMSAQRHGLCRLEWNAVYRAFSERPDKVDRFFYGEASPFRGLLSRFSGDVVSGLLPDMPPAPGHQWPLTEPFRWASGRGFRLKSPVHRSVKGLYLRGYSDMPRQALEVFAAGKRVARAPLQHGPFGFEIAFEQVVAPGSLVEILPQHAVRLAGKPDVVSIAVIDFGFQFEEPLTPVLLGVEFAFGEEAERDLEMALVHGWWASERSHTWSKGEAEIRLAALDRVTALSLRCMANPGVDDQTVAVSLNGEDLGVFAVGASGETTLTIPVADAWKDVGMENRIAFSVSKAGTVGTDPRELGIGVMGVTLL